MSNGYAASIDSNDVILRYVEEAAWGSIPVSPVMKVLTIEGEGFSSNKSRARPGEINPTGQASSSLTTKVEVKGDLKFCYRGSNSQYALGALLAASIGATNQMPLMTSATDFSCTATTISRVGGNFIGAGYSAGMTLRFTSSSMPQLNGFFRVTAVATNTLTIDSGTTVLGTYSAANLGTVNLTIPGRLVNGSDVTTFFFQKQLSPTMYLRYSGCLVTGGSIDIAVGDYVKGSFSFIAKSESTAVGQPAGASNHIETLGGLINSVNHVSPVFRNGVALQAAVQKLSLKWSKDGAATQIAISSAAALGVRRGTLNVSGVISIYFKDFTLYDQFIAETGGAITFYLTDGGVTGADCALGKGFAFTVCNAALMNPKIVAGGPNQDVVADFEVEGNPEISTPSLYGGKTIQIDTFFV